MHPQLHRTVPQFGHPAGLGLRRREEAPAEGLALTFCVGLSLLGLLGSLVVGFDYVPTATQVLPLLAGALLLRREALVRLFAVVGMSLGVEVAASGLLTVRVGNLVVVLLTAVLAHEVASSRQRTGLVGLRGDALLADLRRLLREQGALPRLPGPWRGDAVVLPAGGGPFAGDFVVSAVTGEGTRLEIVLVDVSGKGEQAATRALMLSGALGGLLGSLPPEQFLDAANRYVWRQDWEDGFATAVHLALDLRSGDYSVASAGHPPAGLFAAGSGRWSLVDVNGVALGLLEDPPYERERGRLEPGDAVLLYTDGLVEVAGRDLAVGIDRLLGEAERLVPRGFAGGAHVLVNRAAAGSADDRGLVLVWREY